MFLNHLLNQKISLHAVCRYLRLYCTYKLHYINICVYFSECRDGDVRFFDDNTPQVFWNGKFIGICGNIYWDNNNGASIFCKKLGHETGVIRKFDGEGIREMPSLMIGKCEKDDKSLITCKGGFNVYKISLQESCTTGFRIRASNVYYPHTYTIICSGGKSPRTISCKGKLKMFSCNSQKSNQDKTQN